MKLRVVQDFSAVAFSEHNIRLFGQMKLRNKRRIKVESVEK